MEFEKNRKEQQISAENDSIKRMYNNRNLIIIFLGSVIACIMKFFFVTVNVAKDSEFITHRVFFVFFFYFFVQLFVLKKILSDFTNGETSYFAESSLIKNLLRYFSVTYKFAIFNLIINFLAFLLFCVRYLMKKDHSNSVMMFYFFYFILSVLFLLLGKIQSPVLSFINENNKENKIPKRIFIVFFALNMVIFKYEFLRATVMVIDFIFECIVKVLFD